MDEEGQKCKVACCGLLYKELKVYSSNLFFLKYLVYWFLLFFNGVTSKKYE